MFFVVKLQTMKIFQKMKQIGMNGQLDKNHGNADNKVANMIVLHFHLALKMEQKNLKRENEMKMKGCLFHMKVEIEIMVERVKYMIQMECMIEEDL
jgi:hypothetical protein